MIVTKKTKHKQLYCNRQLALYQPFTDTEFEMFLFYNFRFELIQPRELFAKNLKLNPVKLVTIVSVMNPYKKRFLF